MSDRLYRSIDDRVIAGVCGGLADRMDLDPSLVRVGYAVLALITGVFPLVVVYVVMAIVVPEEPAWQGVRPVDPIGGAAGPASWPGGPTAGTPGAATAGVPSGPGSPPPPPPPGAPGPAYPGWTDPAAGWSGGWAADRHAARAARRAERAARRAARPSDPLPAIIGGLFLVALGGLLLVRGTLNIDWTVVWPAAIVAAGVVLVVAAILPRQR